MSKFEVNPVEQKVIKKEDDDDLDDYDSLSDIDIDDIEKAFENNVTEEEKVADEDDVVDKKLKKKKRKISKEEIIAKKAKKSKFSIQKTTFKNLIKEIIGNNKTISQNALNILRIVAEDEIVNFFEKCQIVSVLNNRKTVTINDIKITMALASKNFVEMKNILDK
jgi:histone H3/H4